MKILESIGSLIGSLQGNQVLRKLSKKKDQGFYRNELEFKQDLKNNLVEVASTANQPLFVPLLLSPGIAYSEVFNNNNDEILADIEVLFQEINYVFSKIKSQEIFFERGVTEAELLIKRLEQNLESAKIETSPSNAFNQIYHNTFIDGSYKLDFLNNSAKEFYYDFPMAKRGDLISLCSIDTKQGKLSLPKFNGVNIAIPEVRVVAEQTTTSEHDISYPGNDILNIVSPSFIQSWGYSVLVRKQLKEPAKLVIALDFGDIKEFNSVTISPNSSDPAYLDEVYTLDSNNIKESIEIEKGILSETKTILFRKRVSKGLFFVFKQDVSQVVPFNPLKPITLAELQRKPSLPLSLDSIDTQVRESIKDPNVKNILGLEQKRLEDSVLMYHYSFLLNSITVSNDSYKNKGIYVSKPEEFKSLRNLGLYVKDMIPTAKHWETNQEILSGSIEYSLFKKDYDSNGNLMKTSFINILPIGTLEVPNERLYFEKTSIVGLRFLAHKKDGDGSNIELYRNGELLIRGVDWKFNKRQDLASNSPFVLETENKTAIELMHRADQIINGIYTAKYTPRYILEPEELVIDNNVRFLENNSILTPDTIRGQEITKTDVYVHVIIRNHVETSFLTPYLDYYRLAGKEE
jgi:hypothetical protein